MFKNIALLFCVIGFLACNQSTSTKTQVVPNGPVFYYWKTTFEFDRHDRQLYDSLEVQQLYLRYFDVKWSPSLQMPIPIGDLQLGNYWDGCEAIKNIDIVPVIYLVNDIFTHTSNWDSLAAQVTRRIGERQQQLAYDWTGCWRDPDLAELDYKQRDTLSKRKTEEFLQLNEIQLDCDWTAKTRSNYFAFLEAMRIQNPGVRLSCTLRLHQFRDGESAGIPPVDRALLMCYNVAPVSNLSTADAVFDPDIIKGYLKQGNYPLPLDAALPLFSWAAAFHEDEFKGILSGMTERQLEDNPLFKTLEEGRYIVQTDTVLHQIYLREGDQLRIDGPERDELVEIKSILTQRPDIDRLFYFDWNPTQIRHYGLDY